MAAAIVSTGISMSLGNNVSDIKSAAGLMAALIASVSYIFTEGKIDAAGVNNITQSIVGIKDSIDKAENSQSDEVVSV